ncbi:MAG TPA: cytochrome c oxidase subunit II [Terriglobales bacterium]|nr:cytochrome c oxidase subunit II [Terriglobales bacterium]
MKKLGLSRASALTTIGLTLLLASCDVPRSTLNPAGPAAEKLANLEWLMIFIFLCVTFFMWVLIMWAMKRTRRGNFSEHAPIDIGGGQGWVTFGGFLFPFIVLTFLFVVGLRAMSSFPMGDNEKTEEPKPDILVIGHQWWWEAHYLQGGVDQHFTTANEFHIPVGKPVDIALESTDVIHSFWVPKLHGKVDLVPGQVNYIRIQADKPGNYGGTCAEYCGAQHAHMELLVVAQTPEDYQAWYQHQLQPGAEPTDPEAVHGKEVFLAGPCILCHTVRGTSAGGTVGPDLTHLASRQYIAANAFQNNKANLEGWVTHAQTMKPDAEMPNLSFFTGTDLRSLVAYLQQLQ